MAVEQVLFEVLMKFQKPDEEGRLSLNAKKIERQGRVPIFQQSRNVHQKINNNYVDENSMAEMQENYVREKEREKRRVDEAEQIKDLVMKIEQAHQQLIKMN